MEREKAAISRGNGPPFWGSVFFCSLSAMRTAVPFVPSYQQRPRSATAAFLKRKVVRGVEPAPSSMLGGRLSNLGTQPGPTGSRPGSQEIQPWKRTVIFQRARRHPQPHVSHTQNLDGTIPTINSCGRLLNFLHGSGIATIFVPGFDFDSSSPINPRGYKQIIWPHDKLP